MLCVKEASARMTGCSTSKVALESGIFGFILRGFGLGRYRELSLMGLLEDAH